MNISSQLPLIPLATAVNPATETLRRENNQREVITQPAAVSQSAAEKGVASDRERSKTPAEHNESTALANIRKQAEQESTSISDDSGHHGGQQQDSPPEQQQQEASPEQNAADTYAEEKQLNQLQIRDQEVRSHERAHVAVGGVVTGTPSYSFEVGPDGKKYAVSGEVSVDLSKVVGNPQATIAKMQKVHAAALAPINPSIQDVRIATAATNIIAQAQSELLAEKNDHHESTSSSASASSSSPQNSSKTSISGVTSQENLQPEEVLQAPNDFDHFIDQTLQAQETLVPTRSPAVAERALRIEHYYHTINQAYYKPDQKQFDLTA